MKIGERLRKARTERSLTQEKVAEEIQVTRQSISNWENNRSYPDIISVIKLSNLYGISLDDLLKNDNEMIKHMDESMNIVKSNRKLIAAIIVNVIILFAMVAGSQFIDQNRILMGCILVAVIISITTLFYQIIKRF